MVIWSGLGFVVAIIGFLALILTEKISESLSSDQQFYQNHPFLILVAMSVAALLTYGFNYFLNHRARSSSDGELAMRKHSLFFVAIKWWPAIFMAIGAAVLLTGAGR